MIKNIVLDMGNVLLAYNPQVPLDLFCRTNEEREIIFRELFEGPEWIQGDLGNLGNDEKYESIQKRVPKEMLPALRRCVYEWYVCLKPIAGAREFCEYAKQKGYRLYVLSNAAKDFYDYFPKFAPLDYFHGVVVSCDLHMIKPDVRIYQYLLDTYGLCPKECFFVDDRAENVKGAKHAGMSGAVFDGDFGILKERYHL